MLSETGLTPRFARKGVETRLVNDLFTLLDNMDPWPFLAGLFVILWVVEVKFGGRAKATKEQILDARMYGYEMAAKHHREFMNGRAREELEREEFEV